MKALDLFCGLGGWSDGLALEGFEVLGVEINQEIAELYKHPVIVADVCSLDPLDFTDYDLIVGSPPCRDFSVAANFGKVVWKIPPDPKGEGMRLINAFLNIAGNADPRYWLMENVPYVRDYLKIEPRTICYLSQTMRRAFWGNYPAFLIPRDYRKGILSGGRNRATGNIRKPTHQYKYSGKLRKWERSRIPLPVARALGRAVANELEDVL